MIRRYRARRAYRRVARVLRVTLRGNKRSARPATGQRYVPCSACGHHVCRSCICANPECGKR